MADVKVQVSVPSEASIGYCAHCVERCEGQHGPCFSEEIGCTEDFMPDDVRTKMHSSNCRTCDGSEESS